MTLTFEAESPPLANNEHGIVMIEGTRIPLDTVVHAFNDGTTAEEIANSYRPLTLAEVYSVIGFYLRHKPDVDRYLVERDRLREEARKEVERRWPSAGLKERLLARKAAREQERAEISR